MILGSAALACFFSLDAPEKHVSSFSLARGNWEIARRDLNNHRLIAMVSTDQNLLDPEYNEYAVSTSRSMMCCRTVAIIVNLSPSNTCIFYAYFLFQDCFIHDPCHFTSCIHMDSK